MKFLWKFIVIALLAANPISAIATDQDAAERLLKVMKVEKQLSGGFEAMTPMIDQLANSLQLNKSQTEELVNIYRDWFLNDIDRQRIIDELAILYSQTFSQQEIESMIVFYSTPEGQKFIEKAPALMQAGAQLGMQEAELAQPQLIEKLTPFLEKHHAK
ncbi:TPA: DUF2059 domain-containing protein [Vibrio parahaemolyticus]|uniref:DUF2059 domain-containing protein n=1 Tax=Vibrio parahaemolyticus TaxID=670 RepID=UPI000425DEEA|nr:DUF2059 domain-containing protein [Vibrio parahaemolyticus]TOJ81884.1 DUF2059 domain-containing protein [Vibrio parahaemolyticus]HAS6731665.1 DUF2059 domain-containing protein [Vibrio parahaemolyticus]HCG7666144.1 DUF2059 domain-containing protein [Vibrio parahaemolyticus]